MMYQVEEVLNMIYECLNKGLKKDLNRRLSKGLNTYKIYAIVIGFFVMVFLLSVDVSAADISGSPLINPLGNLEAYNSVEFTEKWELVDAQEFSYRNIDDKYVYLYLWGDYWYFDVPISPDYIETDNPFKELVIYLEGMGADIISCSREEVVATVPGQDGVLWWAFAKYPTDRYDFWVIREDFLIPGKKLEVDALQEGQVYRFATYNEGNKFLSYKVEIPSGTIQLRASGHFVKGDYESRINYERELSGVRSSIYYLDDIPQQKGRVFWEIQCLEDTTEEISFSLVETLNLPQIEMSNKMGALQIKGSSFGEIWLEPAYQSIYSRSE